MGDFVYNVGYLLSFLVLADRYWAYRAAKAIYNAISGPYPVNPIPDLSRASIAVEGYPHSANSFLRANLIAPDEAVASNHRQWSVRAALDHNVPLVVLVRHPMECVRSRYQRSISRRQGYHNTLYPTVCLATWYLYYRYVYERRARILILPYTLVSNQYDLARAQISGISRNTLVPSPTFADRNALGEEHREIALSWMGRRIRARAERIYELLLSHAGLNTPQDSGAGSREP